MIYDIHTKNKSFLKISRELKKLNIKNNKFMLSLYDESLQGIDPYDENLTLEIQARIVNEATINYWYYIRECVRVPTPGGFSRYILHRGNLAESFCLVFNLNSIVLLPRQHYKTISGAIYYSWVYNLIARNYNMVFSNKQYDDSQLNIKRLNDILDALPKYFRSHANSKKDTDNMTEIRLDYFNNTIKALSTGRDKVGADKLGRGLTIPCIWLDEFAFLPYNEVTYKAAKPALSTAMDIAKKQNLPRGILITTTPNNLDVDNGKFCYNLMKKSAKFTEEFYDWIIETNGYDKILNYIHQNSENDFIHVQFSYKELGKSEAWLRQQIRELEGDMLIVKREILLEWTYANNVSPFTEEQLTDISNYIIRDHKTNLIVNDYAIEILEEPKNLYFKNWILSIDVAGGLEEDSSAFVLIDPNDRKPKMKFKSNRIGIVELSQLIISFVNIYVPNAIIVPERNNHGLALIELILMSPIASNLYYESINDVTTKKKNNTNRLKASKKNKKTETIRYGFNTDKSSRSLLIENLRYIVNEEPELITDPDIFDEIRTLERKKTGKIEHGYGFHDDVLMSYLIGFTILTEGRNINKFLKITTDDSDKVNHNKSDSSLKNILKMNNQNYIDNISNNLTDNILNKFSNKQIENQLIINEYNKDPNKSLFLQNEEMKKKKRIQNITSLNKKIFKK